MAVLKIGSSSDGLEPTELGRGSISTSFPALGVRPYLVILGPEVFWASNQRWNSAISGFQWSSSLM